VNGRIAELWDVVAPVPDDSPNKNGAFYETTRSLRLVLLQLDQQLASRRRCIRRPQRSISAGRG
jgi:hypothetical protein